ncbi:MAG TPA: MBL fold metallo-hydrolase [Lacipirellulaceae bacterium]|nr:MBL fold metallo-hydrolase [Lacipirellulaceae bacterium]
MKYVSQIVRAWVFALCLASMAAADSGKPVAVRWWGQAMVSIETYWNLHVVIDPFGQQVGYKDPQLSADLVLITHEHADHNNAAAVRGEPVVVRGLDASGKVVAQKLDLDRLPNAMRPSVTPITDSQSKASGHQIVVTTIPAWHDQEQGGDRGSTAIFVIDVDGVRIVHCGDLGQPKLTAEQIQSLGRVDVFLLPVGGFSTIDGAMAAEIVGQVRPRIVIPIHFKTPVLAFDMHRVDAFLDAMNTSGAEIVRPIGNTVAVSAANAEKKVKTRVVVLGYEPWQPSGELAELFERKDAASRASAAVFRPLSANQMNFRPSDGTHTPRWNAEHMMGRELSFFTQIFAQRDPAIAPIDLNPAQMPPDYEAAHADWSGDEEARQIERVGALVRRFGYLFDGMDLDERAPNSRWTLRRLFQQMERHYGEHTANVKKKFELSDWPQE